MADVQFDITLKNAGSNTEGLTLFSPVQSASQSANKYSFSTPYVASYPVKSQFTIIDDAGTSQLTLSGAATMAEVVALLNIMNIGTFIVGYNDAVNGNVFHLLSNRNPVSLSIDGVIVGAFQFIETLPARSNSNSDCVFGHGAVVIVSGNDGKIFISTDNGATWDSDTLPNAVAGWSIYQISYTSGGYFAIGNNGTNSKIWFSVTGAVGTWSEVQTFLTTELTGIKMVDLNNGLIYGLYGGSEQILSTSDGGNSLSSVQIIGTYKIGYFQFIDTNNGFLFELDTSEYLYTTDAGLSWTAVDPAFLVRFGFALNANEIFLVGQSGQAAKTPDNGGSWIDISIATANALFSIYAFDSNRLIVGRQGQQWVESLDGGLNWTNHVLNAGGAFTKVYFKSDTIGIAFTDSNFYQYY